MIRNANNGANGTNRNRNNTSSNTNSLRSSIVAGTRDPPQRTGSAINRTNNTNTNTNTNTNSANNQHHLLEQLRMIAAQLQARSSASPAITKPAGQTTARTTARTTTRTRTTPIQQQQQQQQQQRKTQQTTTPNIPKPQTMSRPEVPRSNVGIVPTSSTIGNRSVGTSPGNAINVDSCGGTSTSSVVAVANANANANTTPTTRNNNNNNSNSLQPAPGASNYQAELFPYILHTMLEDVQRMGQTNIVSWNADGKSFRIHDPDSFVSLLLEKYLKKYVGGIASRFTQFRSELKDWGFEDAVDGNRMGETFTHHCFQRGQSKLCRYMRCGRIAEEPAPNHAPAPTIVQPQIQPQPQTQSSTNTTSAIPATNSVTLGSAAQLILQQAQAQAQAKQQQQQQQQQALQQQQQQQQQMQALLNGLTNGSNPVATMILSQIAHEQQQRKQQQQQQLASVMAAAAALQRQHQQQQKTFATTNPAPAPQNPSVRPMSLAPAGLVRTPAPATTTAPTSVSSIRINGLTSQLPIRQFTKTTTAVPNQVKQTKATAPVMAAPTAVSAKRAAFLNKRSKATGAAYRNPNKKQKRTPTAASAAIMMKNRKKSVTSKSSASSHLIKNGGSAAKINGFTLNEDFKQKEVPDLLFPWKLHDTLDDAELSQDIKTNVVSWQADGVSFNIHNKERFVNEVLPRYFENTPKEWDSFINILNSWGFVRFDAGIQQGAYFHRLLVKGKRSVCKQMRIDGKTVSDWMKQHGQFLGRLHALLSYAEKEGKQDIVSWTPDGKKFTVHDPFGFMNSVFPMYFDSLTYSSFEQKLRRWGFMRSPANHTKVDKETKLENAVYSHPHFVRGKVPNLVWVKSETKIPRTLQQHNFLVRLRVMLSDASRHGHHFVVSWAPHGNAFMIHDRPYFSSTIMPNYFKSKFTSFRQSLRNHGFAQIGGNGWDEGAYYHKLFTREEPQLCQGLTQDQMKKAMPEWIPVENEPNFYPEDNRPSAVAAAAMVSMKLTTPTG
eukprot:CAMPEP_0168172968 /NCGR_PEP_ID=MMETSP0139_2-20121125/5592_1 /TAXON_ID=44445 /ORGANISM="Pseudo-nitzschia australis, Strain 10249 10 AB" /LENGTH=1001 /DNA_ID=CAMNT_0008090765 /DNA_START=239 /DNA_END=3244 /DNA_ORIENTATION=+